MLTAARRRPGAVVLALAGALLAGAGLAAGLPGTAQTQEALTPAQKAALLLTAFRKFGGKARYDSVAGRNGTLTIWDLKLEIPAPVDRLSIRGSTGKLIVTAETMLVRRFDYRNPDLPRFADLSIMGVRPGGTAVNDRELRAFRSIFGLDGIVLDIRQNYALDPETGSLNYRNFLVALREVASISLSVRLDGVDFAKLSDPDFWKRLAMSERNLGKKRSPAFAGEALLGAVNQMRIHTLSYSFTDLGGVGKAMAYAAAERSRENPASPKFTANMMRDMVAGALAGANARFSGAFANEVLRKAGRIAMAPGTLTVLAKPSRPLPITRIIGFAAGFAATVDQMKGRKIDLDPVQKFLGLSVSYAPAAR